ncbi:MAG: TonB-dependent receptor [Firmicutes bacterium]|nr:TonB-dependent receptor [Bacillota bacterium]MCM1401906.1 TonB-dependent receptor [Bacteroides sp.]MCM1477964.1 TonB-dependent receptor [Bacteroides sp.]
MKFLRTLILTLSMVLMCSFGLAAQNRTVSGTVVDAADEPLPGVSVTIPGTQTGCMTDIDGKFTLNIPAKQTVLKFTYIGYDEQKVTVAPGQTTVNVIMKENSVMLEETVVIGYGTQKKVNLTGAVASLDGEKLEGRPTASVTNMLQGSVAGLNITTSSGVPGQSGSINIRGQESINSAGPLILIDGTIGELDSVNPNDVESISVIKDASAAAVYGARAAFGVILVTTKSGQAKDGKSTVRYNGRVGWESPTTSTDFVTQGYWSARLVNQFWQGNSHTDYLSYTDYDMQQLLARVNDKTENPERPWVVEETRNGKRQWVYYGNYDWYHMLYRDTHPVQQHNISFSGGKDKFKYFLSGGLDFREGVVRQNPDKFKRYNLRSKIDFAINKWASMSNNTSFYGSTYEFMGNGSIEDTFAYSARHALACFPMKNPDGTWIYSTPYTSYKIGNGRHILLGEGSHRNTNRKTDFTNTTRLTITPIKQLSIVGDFTYRFYQTRNTHRTNNMYYREYPDGDMGSYSAGAGLNALSESANTRNYYSVNAFATYKDTFNEKHNLTVMAGYNYESMNYKNLSATGQNLISENLDDLNLVGTDDSGAQVATVGGGQAEYVLQGIFGRINYDYMGKYLVELSGRYDGSSRFARGNRWGFFPSGSLGWRFSEESFMEPTHTWLSNGKLRASYGSLGNQNVSSYYTFLRLITTHSFNSFSFGNSTVPGKYTSLGDPIAGDLTWEKANQWDLGLDLSFFNNRLSFTGDFYIRDTKGMLTDGMKLPAVYGAEVPQMNNADMRTKGYELALNWNDSFMLFGKPFSYSVGFNLSNYDSYITKYKNNENQILSYNKDGKYYNYYYEGMHIGDIWGYTIDGLFQSDEEAAEYQKNVDLTNVTWGLPGGYQAGDVRFVDVNGDGVVNNGNTTMIRNKVTGQILVEGQEGWDKADEDRKTNSNSDWTSVPVNSILNHGDLKKLGNSLPRLSYGITASVRYFGFDVSAFFQGTGNHYMYPHGQMMSFWGMYGYPYMSFIPTDFAEKIWSEDNPDAYFPRAVGYAATSYNLKQSTSINNRYLQNLRYLRFKNLTVGYTIPSNITKKAYIDKVRVYFTAENLCYWSPLKKNSKYVDPEGVISRSDNAHQNAFYPWPKTYMFGLDISF